MLRGVHVVVVAAAVLAGAACTGGGSGSGCPGPTPYAGESALARDIRADRLGTVTGAREETGLATLSITSQRSVGQLRTALTKALARVELEVLSEDNEGFEAEIYLGRESDGAIAVTRIREDPLCEGRTTVQVSVTAATGG